MGCLTILSFTVVVVSVASFYFIYSLTTPPELPDVKVTYWGPGDGKLEKTPPKPFKINIPDSELEFLKHKLNLTTPFHPPLEGVAFNYGVNSDYMSNFIKYWRNNYNWREREKFLNSLSQFKMNIGGLKIHYIHAKPDPIKAKGKTVLPLLMLHGWPGSVREFYEIIPLLVTPKPDSDFVFEVIAPSLPGYGFSDAAAKPGLGAAQIAAILNELMERLGFNRYYVQGGDWGSIIGFDISVLFPERVIGYHSNMCIADTAASKYRLLVANLFPSLFLEDKETHYKDKMIEYIFLEAGYMHIQATKPDTIGLALTDSPAGLAGYLLEKMSTWTNPSFKNLSDGGLETALNKDAVLDNIHIYWFNKAITPSMRLYSEFFIPSSYSIGVERSPVSVPTCCARFPHEIFSYPKYVLEGTYKNLISVSDKPKGGHFPALEVPGILAEDVWDCVKKVQKIPRKKK